MAGSKFILLSLIERDLKEPTLLFEKSRERFPDVYSTLHTSFMSHARWVTESS